MTPDQYGRRAEGFGMDHLARAYREMLARDQAMLELLTSYAVYSVQQEPPERED